MPILTVRTPPPILEQSGPGINVTLSLIDVHQQVLLADGVRPASKEGIALIDTGASSSCFDKEAADEIGLPVIGRTRMSSASGSNIPARLFLGKLVFSTRVLDAQIGMEADLKAQGIIALIGRDTLSTMVLVYNGLEGTFALAH